MADTTTGMPRLFPPRSFAGVWWWLTTVAGLAALAMAVATWSVPPSQGPAIVVTAAVSLALAVMPVRDVRRFRHPVELWFAPVFAALYVWGWQVAVILAAVSAALRQVRRRNRRWALPFNASMYVISVGAAAGVLAWGTALTQAPAGSFVDLLVMLASWLAFVFVNFAVVAGMAATEGMTFAESFSEELPYYTMAIVSVLAMSPFLALCLQPGSGAWVLLPLVLLPALALRQATSRLRDQEDRAERDPLTGLANRARVDADLLALQRAEYPSLAGAIMIDLVDADGVGDRFGPAAADEVLREVARRLVRQTRPQDTVAHIDADVFVVLMPAMAGVADVRATASRIRDAVQEPVELVGDGPSPAHLRPRVSMGVAVSLTGPESEDLLRRAGAAHHAAKRAGGGIVYRW